MPKSRWRIWLGLIVSASCVGLLFWLIDWHQAGAALRSMDVRWLAPALVLLIGCYIAFAARWWVLLDCDPALRPPRLFAVLMMGLGLSAVMPLRPGDALRVYLVGHVYGAGASRTLASIVLERILDVATILLLGGVVALKVKLPESMSGLIVALSFVLVAGVAVLLAIALFAESAAPFLVWMTTRWRHRWSRVLAAQIMEFVRALTLRGSRTRLALAVAAGAVGWAAFSAAMIACAAAFNTSQPVVGGLLVVVLTNLGGMVPSSPGSIGIYHALAVLALSVTGTPREVALAVAVISHALIAGNQVVLGLLCFISSSSVVRGAIPGKQPERRG